MLFVDFGYLDGRLLLDIIAFRLSLSPGFGLLAVKAPVDLANACLLYTSDAAPYLPLVVALTRLTHKQRA